MSENVGTTYPDILGYISSGVRANVGLVQLTTAVRPRVARAGRPFEMIMLVQNAADIELDVTVTLKLPDKDQKSKRGRFVTKADRLIIRLDPAAVGAVILPVSTMPDTAPGAGYKIGMETRVEPVNKVKPSRIRPATGGDFDPETLASDRRSLIEEFRSLSWMAESPTLRPNVLETPFTVMSGTVGKFADLKPSWTSLWTLADHVDDALLFRRMATTFAEDILPALKQRKRVYPVVLEYVRRRFSDVGFVFNDVEVDLMARLLTLILEFAALDERDLRYIVGEDFNISRYLRDGYLDQPNNPVYLPNWANALLRVLVARTEAAKHPVKAICYFAFEELLRDAMIFAFNRIEHLLTVEVGTTDERTAYMLTLLEAMNDQALDMNLAYMPMVLGGIIAADYVLLDDEQAADVTNSMRRMIDLRHRERNEETEQTFRMANDLIELAANKYQGRDW